MRINVFCTALVLGFLNYAASYATPLLRGFPLRNPTFPETLEQFRFEKRILGGTGGVSIISHEQTGERYTLKCTANEEAFKEELLTDGLYRALGILVPDFAIYTSAPKSLFPDNEGCMNAKLFRLSMYIDKDTTKTPPQIAQKIKDHFVADALLSNWDIVAGQDYKNVILDKEDKLWRVDNGGSLRYRAKGDLKEFKDQWVPSWMIDLTTMTNPDLNLNGSLVYKDISKSKLTEQARAIILKSDDFFKAFDTLSTTLQIRDADTLRSNLLARFQDLHDRLAVPLNPGEVRPADRWARAKPGFSSAGVFLYTFHEGKPRVLLSKRAKSNQWNILSGSSRIEDLFLADTARKEALYDSFERVQLTEQDLSESPSHDFVIEKGLLRTYFVKHHYIPAESLNNLVNEDEDDLIEFAWVPLNTLLESLLHKKHFVRTLEGEWTSTFTLNGQTQDLYAPFFLSSRQRPALNIIDTLSNLQKPKLTRTQELMKAIDPQTGPKGLVRVPDFKNTTVRWGTEDLEGIRSTHSKRHASTFEIKIKDPLKEQKQLVDALMAKSRALSKLNKASHTVYTEAEEYDVKHLKDTPLTQSEAHLKLIMKDQFTPRNAKATRHFQSNKAIAKQNIETFLNSFSKLCNSACTDKNDTFVSSLQMALTNEIDHPESFVFYHGTQSLIGFMYDLYTEFRRQLMILNAEHLVVLRGSNLGFERFRDADDFYKIFAENQKGGVKINYTDIEGRNYRDFGLSVNPFLFGSDGRPTSATYHLFQQGISVSPPGLEEMFHSLVDPLGIRFDFQKYLTLHDNYFGNNDYNTTTAKVLDNRETLKNLKVTNGRLFQIFIHPSVVNKIAYVAMPGGQEIEFVEPFTTERRKTGIKDLLYIFRWNPEFASRQMPLLLRDKYKEEDRPSFNSIQARLFLDPKIFLDPRYVQIRSYSRFPLRPAFEEEYKKTLRELVSEDLSRWLTSNVPVVKGAFTEHVAPSNTNNDDDNDTSTETNLPKIQRLYKHVVKDVTGQLPAVTYPDLVTMIEGNKLVLLNNFLKEHPHINLNSKIFSIKHKKWFYPLELAYENSTDMAILLLEFGANLTLPVEMNDPDKDVKDKPELMKHLIQNLYDDLSMDDPNFKTKLMTLTRAVLKEHTVASLLYTANSAVDTKGYIAYFVNQNDDLDFFTLLISAANGKNSERSRFLYKTLADVCILNNKPYVFRQLLDVVRLNFSEQQFITAANHPDLEIFDLMKSTDLPHFKVYGRAIIKDVGLSKDSKQILKVLERFKGSYGNQFDQLTALALEHLVMSMNVDALEEFRNTYGFNQVFKSNGLKFFAEGILSLINEPERIKRTPQTLEYILSHVDKNVIHARKLVENLGRLKFNLRIANSLGPYRQSIDDLYGIIDRSKVIPHNSKTGVN